MKIQRDGFPRLSILIFLFIILFSVACQEDQELVPQGNEQARAVFNQAYSENYDADNINDILENAKNAYVLVDPFMDGIADKISLIKANNNEVGGYISIGTGENWRDDFDLMKAFLVSVPWGEWEGEFFVKETTTGIMEIMKARIDKLVAWDCDWVEFDNMDWFFYEEVVDSYGINVTEAEGISYYKELCTYAHSKGLKCMAKNHVIEAEDFDGVLYESYHTEKDWWDHAGAQQFLDAGKLVIINHYNEPYPNNVYIEYIELYNEGISYICESSIEKRYIHYNQ
jgi:hypothetical protein